VKAVTFNGVGRALTLQEVAVPEPGPGQMLLKVRACGICGSDLHAYQAGAVPEGMVFGHEFAGEVAALGEGVTGWNIGDRVAALGGLVCGQCEACLDNRISECAQMELIGFTHPGAYAEYVLCQAAASVRVPEALSWDQAALVEPLAVGLAAFRDCRLPLAGNVLVIGAGVIGIAVAKWARFFGAEHVGISDLDGTRLERAARAGATLTIDAGQCPDPVQAFRDGTGSDPDVIVECVGRPMLQQLIDVAPRESHIVSVGAAMEPDTIAPHVASTRKVRLTFSFGYELEDFAFILRMIESGRMDTANLVTRSISLDEAPAAFAELLVPNSHCKVMIEPQ
jgi:(R,R)-butanediol dehydrogenase/meso-butanediol dehydrogenase/diacetyl reductase